MNELLKINDHKYEVLIEKIKKLIKGSIFEGKVYIVGGFVRDAILGSPIKDVDIVVEAPDGGIGFATWLAYNTNCFVNTKNPCVFPNYGTAKVQITSDPEVADIELECVQTRKEKYNKDSRNPETAYGSIEEDAMRRDLTINALYYNISTDEICDFTKRGLDDIKNHVIRTTGEANMIFEDDPLRILRVVRFSTRLGWPIEKNTWVGMILNSKRINILTQERVTDELNKMLLSDNPAGALDKLDKCNVLHRVLPSLSMSKHVYQDLNPKRTLYEHILQTVDKTPKVLETRLAALFHDIGKLKTYEKSFMYHSQIGADMAEEVMKAMKYSNAIITTVKKAIENHEEFSSYFGGVTPRPAVLRKFVVKFDGNDKDLEVALDLIHANNISQMYGKKIKFVPEVKKKIAELDKRNESGKNLVIPINGKDIMAEFNLKPGPTLGLIMDKVKSKVIEDPYVTKEDLFKYVEAYLKAVV
jgi:poly(A) polymerase